VPATTTSSRLRRRLDAAVDALVAELPHPSDATVSVWLGAPGGPASYEREAATTHYAASTMKLPLVVAAFRLAERGALDLEAPVPVHDDFASAYDGSRFVMRQDYDQDDDTWARVGGTATLRHLARHAIVKSGNLATNLVLEQVGVAEVAAVLRDAGCSPATVLPRGIEDAAAREAGLDNLVTAADLSTVLGAVATRSIAAADTCEQVEAVLAAQEHRDQVPAGLPAGTYVANKTGWIDHVAHDVALVRPDDRPDYVLTVCTSAEAEEEALYALNAGISRAVWDAWGDA
jgi:beta-lactamase class A